jgi:hypothetical protein
MTTALTILAASGNAPAKRDLAAHLAALTDGQLQSLVYGEHAEVVLDCEVPLWLADAAYDEQDRRMEAKIANGTMPTWRDVVEVAIPARRA